MRGPSDPVHGVNTTGIKPRGPLTMDGGRSKSASYLGMDQEFQNVSLGKFRNFYLGISQTQHAHGLRFDRARLPVALVNPSEVNNLQNLRNGAPSAKMARTSGDAQVVCFLMFQRPFQSVSRSIYVSPTPEQHMDQSMDVEFRPRFQGQIKSY